MPGRAVRGRLAGMLKFLAWRGPLVLCRCACGRLATVRPVYFVKSPVRACPVCAAWLALARWKSGACATETNHVAPSPPKPP